MTRERSRFIQEHKRIDSLLEWYIVSAIHLDEAVRKNAKLQRGQKSTESNRPKELYIGAGATRKMASKRFYQLMAEMALCRVVDNYLSYVTDLLGILFRTRPECLKSSETITLEFALAHKTTSRLIRAIADRQVNKLSYRGMKDLNEYTSKQLGLALFGSSAELSQGIQLIEMRNLIVHSRGVVNDTFLSRTGNPHYGIGSQLSFSFSSVQENGNFLARCVEELEQRAHSKFGFAMPISNTDDRGA